MRRQKESVSRQVSYLATHLINKMDEHELHKALDDLVQITANTQWNEYEFAFKRPLLYCINKRLMSFN